MRGGRTCHHLLAQMGTPHEPIRPPMESMGIPRATGPHHFAHCFAHSCIGIRFGRKCYHSPSRAHNPKRKTHEMESLPTKFQKIPTVLEHLITQWSGHRCTHCKTLNDDANGCKHCYPFECESCRWRFETVCECLDCDAVVCEKCATGQEDDHTLCRPCHERYRTFIN